MPNHELPAVALVFRRKLGERRRIILVVERRRGVRTSVVLKRMQTTAVSLRAAHNARLPL